VQGGCHGMEQGTQDEDDPLNVGDLA